VVRSRGQAASTAASTSSRRAASTGSSAPEASAAAASSTTWRATSSSRAPMRDANATRNDCRNRRLRNRAGAAGPPAACIAEAPWTSSDVNSTSVTSRSAG
jgi:hypothetical protein